ncbi:ATP-dependent RecD-like DNA helicase [Desulfobacter sp.]|jgi:exodeoxyribonuclease V alpha subunit|uniref:SF1B family DNA helicase RecD2 n=1 Tax=Desulfobacter sp. TaxID=2294 RepID=UPI000E8D83C9|nr:ATP-dependent RecD-like DNA helicase [Desulfobacter sp.]HBT89576.1 ATP-dependent RecD-like DNA helicase [Desulfobacter sp.]
MITINGTLSRITFQNPENHYTVCRVAVPKVADAITVVGHLPGVAQGERLKLKGTWTSHPKYGEQFKADSFEITLPSSMAGIRKYLSSGIIPGINQELADRIVDTFGEQTLEIIENEPDRLLDVYGIGKIKQKMIETAWNAHHSVRRVMDMLQGTNIDSAKAAAILKTYGDRALEVLTEDTFRIARDIPAIGFAVVDELARALGTEKEAEERLKACLVCRLLDLEQDGHMFEQKEDLIRACAQRAGVSAELLSDALGRLNADNEVVIEKDRVYLAPLHKAEAGISRRIKALLSMSAPDFHLDNDLINAQVLSAMAVQLSREQMDVLTRIMGQKISIITGGPGTGKTTLIKALCVVFRMLRLKVMLAAPTGRAARRLTEVTGRAAKTLHKLLGFNPDTETFEYDFTNPLDLDLLVVDEASMVDTQLMYRLSEALPAGAGLILVGDTFQLPSVGAGNVLSDIIESAQVEVFALTRIFRQARKSPIVMHAHSIRNGQMPDIKSAAEDQLSQFYFIEAGTPARVADTICELCAIRIPKAFPHIRETQVLTPMHRGEAGTISLNQHLQAVLNDTPGGIESHGHTFKTGDKVMHLKNNYDKEVFNGDIGRVIEADKSTGQVVVDYEDRTVAYDLPDLDELTLAYAISVHKSQGSEYDAVIIALTTAHFPLLQRNLLYTAMTRGKSLVIIVGSTRAFKTAFDNNRTALRRSGLKERLEENL